MALDPWVELSLNQVPGGGFLRDLSECNLLSKPCQIQMKKQDQPLAGSPAGQGRAGVAHNRPRSQDPRHPHFLAWAPHQPVSSQPQHPLCGVSVAPIPSLFPSVALG